jgi:hypothetical protein
MYTKHQTSISRAWIPTAGRILRNRRPELSSAFNQPRPKAWYGCSTKHPCPSPRDECLALNHECESHANHAEATNSRTPP